MLKTVALHSNSSTSTTSPQTVVFHYPHTAPSVPRLLSVTRNLSDGFELNWLPPREPNGRPVYEIEYGTDDTNFTTVDTGSRDTYYNLTGLQHNTTYYIRVVAVNYIESNSPIRGQESNTLTVTLGHQPPLTPITTPTTTDMPSPGTTGGISGTYVCPVKQYGCHYNGMMMLTRGELHSETNGDVFTVRILL